MSKKELLEQKQIKLSKLSGEVEDLKREIEKEETYPRLVSLIGTGWKYRNSYSCPQKPSDYWNVYRKILAVKPNCSALVAEFSTDCHGEMTAKTKWECHPRWFPDSWTQCTDKEINAAYARLVGRVGNLMTNKK